MSRLFAERLSVAGRAVGAAAPVYVIAEAGVAHFGDEGKARALVDLAVEGGADAVKFQIFEVDALIARAAPEWRARLGSRQLPYSAFERIRGYAGDRGITFFATAHDEPSLDFLVTLDVPVYKVGSGEVRNWTFLRRIASLGRPVFVSTGMYQRHEVAQALAVCAGVGNRDVALLHCVTSYPTPPAEVRLGNIPELRRRFAVVTGYSDHTAGYHFPLAAVALGAQIIEKHITLEYDIPDAQDWKVSCGPDDFRPFVQQLREIEAGLSGAVSEPSARELANAAWAAKSLVASHDIAAGVTLRSEDLAVKRPGTGIPPTRLADVVGRTTVRPVSQDALLDWSDLA